MAPIYTNNYIGLTDTGITPIQDQNTSALTSSTIVGNGDKYNIDITSLVRTWKTEDTPFLAIMDNMAGAGSATSPYHTWIDEYDGDSWVDIALDNLRLASTALGSGGSIPSSGYGATIANSAVGIGSSSYVGGTYKFIGVNPGDLDAFHTTLFNVSGVTTKANVNAAALMGTGTVDADDKYIIMRAPTTNIIGSAIQTYNLFKQFANFCGYTQGTNTTATNIVKFGTGNNPLYFAFDDMYGKDSSNVVHHYEEVLMRIEAVRYSSAGLDIVLNVSQSNIAGLGDLSSILLANAEITGDSADDDDYIGLISHPSRMAMIGLPVANELPVPEGDKFTMGGNLSFGRERKENFVEIFRSPAYGVTGTHQASKFRFGDDFAKTRAMYMAQYKKKVNYKLITGVKYETVADATNTFVKGQPVRSVGGLLDFALFPINYKTVKLAPQSGTADQTYQNLNKFIDSIANGTFAFRNSKGSANISLLCSKAFLRRLAPYVAFSMASNNGMGGQVQVQQPNELNFGIKTTTFMSTDGVRVNFIHEPALDYMVSFPVAYHQFGVANVRPQDILLNIDFNNVRKVTFRNDRILGSIQDIGQDAFLEGITGDHTFELSFPKNHGVIYCPAS